MGTGHCACALRGGRGGCGLRLRAGAWRLRGGAGGDNVARTKMSLDMRSYQPDRRPWQTSGRLCKS